MKILIRRNSAELNATARRELEILSNNKNIIGIEKIDEEEKTKLMEKGKTSDVN